MWLMHALESFYDTPKGTIERSLKNRIMLLLGEPIWGQKLILRKIGALYDERSAYVHGVSPIHHPLHNDIMDARLEAYVSSNLERCGLVTAIIVGSIQKMIREGWKEVRYEEVLIGL
jgi:hypothetical protein